MEAPGGCNSRPLQRRRNGIRRDEISDGGGGMPEGLLPSDKIAGGGRRRPTEPLVLPSDRPVDESVGEVEELKASMHEPADRMNLVRQPEVDLSPAVTRPWNLRPRSAPGQTKRRRSRSRSPPPPPPPPAAHGQERSVRLRSEDAGRRKEERRRFSVELTREEIEEDVLALTGSRPRRRPKKRLRSVQNQLEPVFPGAQLTEITAELYKVEQPA